MTRFKGIETYFSINFDWRCHFALLLKNLERGLRSIYIFGKKWRFSKQKWVVAQGAPGIRRNRLF